MDFLQTLLKDIRTKANFFLGHTRDRLPMAPNDTYVEQPATREYYCDDHGWFI